MCGRYAAVLPPEALQQLYGLLNRLDMPPRYNIQPTQPIGVVWQEHGQRTAQLVRWGYVPGWVKDPREFSLLINARAETMAEKPSFRDAVKHSRCVVPALGYYEWMTGPDGKKRPYFITRADGETMSMAGLYSHWSGAQGEEVDTACIVTVTPNLDLSSVHDRMPAVLMDKDAVDAWLDTGTVNGKAAAELCHAPPLGTLLAYRVGKAVGSTKSEGPDLIHPLEDNDDETPAPQPPKAKAAGGGGGGQLDLF
jgi:putative SOS response-associated peptidase YedK